MKWKKLTHFFLGEAKNLFIPHPKTHEKAHLLSWHFLAIYVLLFMLLRVSFDLANIYQPGVLGINSNIGTQQIIEDTNKERQKQNLPLLRENKALSQAAYLKAQNMFEENYWAHFSPSGKDPWGFILGSGYKFSYAGENLAKNFYNSSDVVSAWMDSPTHRDNILNSNYQDIGIAVVEGTLGGQKTTLVVQMFGKTYEAVAAIPPPAEINLGGQKITLQPEEVAEQRPLLVASSYKQNTSIPATFDPFNITRYVGVSLISFIVLLLVLDFIILKRRGVFKISSHHFAHLSFLGLSGTSLFLAKVGEIL